MADAWRARHPTGPTRSNDASAESRDPGPSRPAFARGSGRQSPLAIRSILKRSVRVATVVGTFLVIVNQSDKLGALADGTFPTDLLWRIPVTYCVPFLVATYGALGHAGDETLGPGE